MKMAHIVSVYPILQNILYCITFCQRIKETGWKNVHILVLNNSLDNYVKVHEIQLESKLKSEECNFLQWIHLNSYIGVLICIPSCKQDLLKQCLPASSQTNIMQLDQHQPCETYFHSTRDKPVCTVHLAYALVFRICDERNSDYTSTIYPKFDCANPRFFCISLHGSRLNNKPTVMRSHSVARSQCWTTVTLKSLLWDPNLGPSSPSRTYA